MQIFTDLFIFPAVFLCRVFQYHEVPHFSWHQDPIRFRMSFSLACAFADLIPPFSRLVVEIFSFIIFLRVIGSWSITTTFLIYPGLWPPTIWMSCSTYKKKPSTTIWIGTNGTTSNLSVFNCSILKHCIN